LFIRRLHHRIWSETRENCLSIWLFGAHPALTGSLTAPDQVIKEIKTSSTRFIRTCLICKYLESLVKVRPLMFSENKDFDGFLKLDRQS
jgi:hypothetical protein